MIGEIIGRAMVCLFCGHPVVREELTEEPSMCSYCKKGIIWPMGAITNIDNVYTMVEYTTWAPEGTLVLEDEIP